LIEKLLTMDEYQAVAPSGCDRVPRNDSLSESGGGCQYACVVFEDGTGCHLLFGCQGSEEAGF
jgi:hypothetical protein